MRTLSWQEVEDILVGATILGCGGGGGLAYGLDLMRPIYDSGRAVMLAAAEEVEDEAMVACPYAVGAMTTSEIDPFAGREPAAEHPSVLSVRALGDHLGQRFAALICGELGGSSVADAFYPAAVLGVPIIDADPVGRAVPEVQHSMLALHGAPIAPFSVVNEIGDTAVFTDVADDERAEALIRAIAVASRNAAWVADHGLPWSDLRGAVVHGTIGLAERVGRAQRQAAGGAHEVASEVAASAEGAVVFGGTVTTSDWKDVEGFTIGETTIEGTDRWASSVYRVWFKNENLMSWRDGAVDVTCPDLICILDESGMPLTNPEVEPELQVSVVAFPSAPGWRTAGGIASMGPSHFGFDAEFVPLEVRHSR